jgi:hypothetical protein
MFLGGSAKAGPVFTYSASPSPPSTSFSEEDETNTITFTGLTGSGNVGANPGLQFLNINLPFDSGDSLGGDFDTFNQLLSFPLTITDSATLATHTLNFQGTVAGDLGGSDSTVTLSSLNLLSPQDFILGGFQHHVTFALDPTGLGVGDNFLTFNDQVTPIPEPTSLALFGLVGLGAAGYCGWRRRNPPTKA